MDRDYIIITGMSGAGKSVAVRALEDVGFYCIDNLPFPLLNELFRLDNDTAVPSGKVAIVMDIRTGDDFTGLVESIDRLKKETGVRVIFLDASDSVLLARYKETRRVHPVMMQTGYSLEDAISAERQMLNEVFNSADYVVDTSLLSTALLKEKILSYVVDDKKQSMSVEVVSFGFKYGVPNDADLIFDVRCLKNPFYVPRLRKLTGNDAAVSDYVFSDPNAEKLLDAQEKLIDMSLPLYINEGKGHLTICYGCTGGNHRSVAFANRLHEHIKEAGYACSVHHRDLSRKR